MTSANTELLSKVSSGNKEEEMSKMKTEQEEEEETKKVGKTKETMTKGGKEVRKASSSANS